MNTVNNKVYKFVDKKTGKEYIGTTWKLAQDLYLSQGSITYAVKKGETRDFTCNYVGKKIVVYKVSYAGKVYEGTLDDIASEMNVAPRTIQEMYYRQMRGVATNIRILNRKEDVLYE